MPGESTRIVANLKAALKSRGITYAELAHRIGLSEASVKRVLSRGTLSLRRLEQVCEVLGSSVADVVQLQRGAEADRGETLSLEQEKALANDPRLFACYHLVANGRSSREIETDMRVSARRVQQWMEQLKSLGLVTLPARGRARPATVAAVKWRPDGPVRRMYEREVRAEFLHSLFGADREAMHFRVAELSEASCRVLQRKLERLATDFRELADLDSTLPSGEKRNMGCMLAMRPWVFSRFLKALG